MAFPFIAQVYDKRMRTTRFETVQRSTHQSNDKNTHEEEKACNHRSNQHPIRHNYDVLRDGDGILDDCPGGRGEKRSVRRAPRTFSHNPDVL